MARWYINPNHRLGKINEEIYGHFSEHLGRCIYEGLYVGEDSVIPNTNGMRNDVVEALKAIKLPVLRWPGGCFADEYHWKDGIGPKEKRKRMVNTHWGGVVEDNSFGTHEFMELCRQLGCKAYINGNMGSGTVQEMSEWVEYLTFDGNSPMAELRAQNGHPEPFKVDYFGIGNECWGGGGSMRPEYYADEYRRYQTFVKSYHPEAPIYKIACGADSYDYFWTEGVLKTVFEHEHQKGKAYMNGLSLHYYTLAGTWQEKGKATGFDERLYYITLNRTLEMESLIKGHGAIMDQYDPEQKIGMIIDEWGTWYEVEPGTNPGFLYQQNTMRDAMVAGINLNLFNKNCSRVKMANIAQVANVLQAVVLTDQEKMILTPTYHVFQMYQSHQGASLVESSIEIKEIGVSGVKVPNLTESGSIDSDGTLHLTVTNLSAAEGYDIEAILHVGRVLEANGSILTGEINDHNTFLNPFAVKQKEFDKIQIMDRSIQFRIPACSIIKIDVTFE